MAKASSARKLQNWELSPVDVLAPLLHPGEHLELALSGATGWFQGLSLLDLPWAFLSILGGAAAGGLHRTTYIGITGEELVFATSKDPDKPSRIERTPLAGVRIVKFKESRTAWLIDVLVIDTGKRKLTLSTLPRERTLVHELATTLDRHRQSQPFEQVPPLPLGMRLASWFQTSVVEGDIVTTLRDKGPARASLRASQLSLKFLGLCIAAGILFLGGLLAFGAILPTDFPGPFRDILLFILLIPLFLAALPGTLAALTAAGLALYSIFKRGEKPLTILAALLSAGGLTFVYYIFVILLLTTE